MFKITAKSNTRLNMRVVALSSLVIFLFLFSLFSSSLVLSSKAATSVDLDFYEQKIVELANVRRAEFNLPPLRNNRELTVASRWFSRDSIVNRPGGYCGHQASDGSWPSDRAPRFGYYGTAGAENAFCGGGVLSPENAIEGWMNSPGHRANLLNPDSREIGVGYYIEANRFYIAQMFGQDAAYPPVTINREAVTTNLANVSLYIYGAMPNSTPLYTIDRPVRMRVSNQPSFNDTSWEPYSLNKNWTLLSTSEGFKTVYVQLEDAQGKSITTSDNIYYGTQIPYNNFDTLAQGATHFENISIGNLNSAGKPYMQFSDNWGFNVQNANMSLNWGNGSLIDDSLATNAKAFQLRPAGNNESAAWVFTTSYLRNLPSQVYVRLRLTNLNAPRAVIKIRVNAAAVGSELTLNNANFTSSEAYQDFPINFSQATNPNEAFLTISVSLTDPDNATNINVDRMDFYTAPETFSQTKNWQIPNRNYRGSGIRVRYTDNLNANSGFSNPQTLEPILPQVYNPVVTIPSPTPTLSVPSPTPTLISTPTLSETTPTPTPISTPTLSVPTPTAIPSITNQPSPTVIIPTNTPTVATPTNTPNLTPIGGGSVYTPQPAANADPAFGQVWTRTDEPILSGRVSRSWMWGDRPAGSALLLEPYENRQRLVQYHDKSRMEINNPNGNRNDLFFVTNGLLVRELISGQMQVGDNSFISRQPAQVSVAGDTNNPNAPTYASFQAVSAAGQRANDKLGQPVVASLAANGNVSQLNNLPASVKISYYDTNLGHNIPDVFWNFMNSRGLVRSGSNYVDDTVVSWLYAMGYPISEPYWIRALVGGVEKDILVQMFERRVLTYTPSNSASFQVEMGNVGQHYYRWRYVSL